MSMRERAAREEEEGGGGGKAAAAYIPADVYEEILYRLPCTQVSKLRFVCKDWLRLISSPEFIKKHLERSKGSTASSSGTRILAPSRGGKIRLYRYAQGNINVISERECPIPNPYNQYGYLLILGSCNGLVLCEIGYKKIALINPCTGMMDTRDLPAGVLGDNIICTWFGQHPSTQEYVLVLVRIEFVNGGRRNLIFRVCSLSGNIINTVSIENLNVRDINQFVSSFQCIGTFLHGRLHFPASYYSSSYEIYTILGFDFERNKIFKMMVPSQSYFTLGVVEGCLSATSHQFMWLGYIIEMWIVKEGWSKYAKINVGYNVLLNPIAYFPNGDVIFEGHYLDYTGGRGTIKIVSRYNLKDMETKQYFEAFNTCGAIACVAESLVTPAMVWRGGRNQDYIHTFTRQLEYLIYNID